MKYKIVMNGRTFEVEVESADAMLLSEYSQYAPAAPAQSAAPTGETVTSAENASATTPKTIGKGKIIEAPMPGTVVQIGVSVGQAIKKGDVLIILEAMKMENEITAPRDGTVIQLLTQSGATVNTGTPLVAIE